MKYLLPILFAFSACDDSSYHVGDDYIFECGMGEDAVAIPDLPWGDYTTAYCGDNMDSCDNAFTILWNRDLDSWSLDCNGASGFVIVHVNWIPEPNL